MAWSTFLAHHWPWVALVVITILLLSLVAALLTPMAHDFDEDDR